LDSPGITQIHKYRGSEFCPWFSIDKLNDSGQVWIKWAKENDGAPEFRVCFDRIRVYAYK